VEHWKNGFDWRKQEAALNSELPQYTKDLDVDGVGTLNIHYIHKKSEVDRAIPLLFIHGWPGSFIEARKLIPLLAKASPDHPSFHVVAYSLPGSGFSTAPTKKGFGLPQYAEVGHKLMLALGYKEYVTQGGDWGARITRMIAHKYGPTFNKAWHTNLPLSPPPTTGKPLVWLRDQLSALPFFGYSDRVKAGLGRTAQFRGEGSGYWMIQSTRPQTLGYSLADSPVGLLAWIYEKLVDWADDYAWNDDEVLTWVSIYYFSRAGPAASLRIYYEAVHVAGGPQRYNQVERSTIPTGYSYFRKEILQFPRSWTKTPYLVFESIHDDGGHFAAYERPEELADDLRKMFGKGGGAYGVVKHNNGFNE